MREVVILACSKCKRRNYTYKKNKRIQTSRLEFKKFCRFCGEHTPHKETR
ncbi:MAG: 50S ribosomal protein L33 [Candidatus Eisenbacteria sp.]|nr:50S ribosomal protein L33 [Candidatus Eisenbacteria bacterium]